MGGQSFKMKNLRSLEEHISKVVLIDDDPVFCSVMLGAAKQKSIAIDTFQSLLEIGYIGNLNRYKVAIVDFDLGQMNGLEIADYLSVLFGDIPMILVSCLTPEEIGYKELPRSVKGYFNKLAGHQAILDSTQEFLNVC
jgi:ActR/RegA family two-component response regulator